MKYLLAVIMVLCTSVSWAASNDMLLNLRNPAGTSPFTPTLKVDGMADNSTNPTVKVPVLPCVATAAAPVYTEGAIVPCSTDLAGGTRQAGGGAAISDVNLIEILGVAPSATNPLPGRLSTGVAYYDARDRNWTLSSGTDSVSAVQSGTWNIGTLTSITNPVAVTGTFFQATQPVSGTFWQATQPVSGTFWQATQPVSGTVTILSTVSSANNDGTCPSGAASFAVLASNASRTWATVWASPANTDDVFVKLGATATSSDARIAPGQSISFVTGRIYTGAIDALPASGTQAVCAMELN